MTTFRYPFDSSFAKQFARAREDGAEIDEWQQPGLDLPELISCLEGPILEIGGPSDQGYYYLRDVNLPSRVIISNVTQNAMPYAPNAKLLQVMIEKIVDGRHFPYEDNSLAMVLASHLSLVDERQYDFSDISDVETEKWTDDMHESEKVLKEAADSGIIDEKVLKVSLRFGIASEALRALKPGGIYMTDATEDEIKVYELLGFTKIASINRQPLDYDKPYFDVVFQK